MTYLNDIPPEPQLRTVTETKRDKDGWIDQHNKHQNLCSIFRAKTLLVGDSIMNGLRVYYPWIWDKYFVPLKTINLGIGGDKTENVLWRVKNLSYPTSVEFVVLQVGTNNTVKDDPKNIVHGILAIAKFFLENKADLKIIVCGLLPRGLHPGTKHRNAVDQVNNILEHSISNLNQRRISYLKPDQDWIMEDGVLSTNYYYIDHLHLSEEGDVKFANSIYNEIARIEL